MAKPSVHITRNGVEKKFWGGKAGRKCPQRVKLPRRPCFVCGKHFHPERPWGKFCSSHCREKKGAAEKRKKLPPSRVPIGFDGAPFGERECPTCKIRFTSTRPTKKYCSHTCFRKRMSENWMNKNRARGLCYQCKNPPIEGNSWCEKHWFGQLAWRCGLRGKGNGEKLKSILVSQNYTCPYSGRTLTIGKNASVDHIQPRSKFPHLTGEISNMEWVDEDVNRAKRTMSREEFISMCVQISEYTQKRQGDDSQRHQTAPDFRRVQA